ncbi:Butyrate--CoA ligase [Actinobacteria bacterium OK074]|nr:Butyrate--CoA ligase [Actinobacteria bacterium OK074]
MSSRTHFETVSPSAPTEAHQEFRAARDVLLRYAHDQAHAHEVFRWPRPKHFNWALDWFDPVARDNDRPALWVITPDGDRQVSFAYLGRRSDQVAGWLRARGVRRGDRVALLLDNGVEVWELLLALMKLRAVAVPLFTTLGPEEVDDRLRRATVRHVVATSAIAAAPAFRDTALSAVPGLRVQVGGPVDGWQPWTDADRFTDAFVPEGPTPADELMCCFFTSGSTARPKLVGHTHTSYPIGHLSGMFWAGLKPGDTHLNISSPGWAKHPWSSLFAPWNAEAQVVSVDTRHADPDLVLEALERTAATSVCAPPSIWRRLVAAGLTGRRIALREAMSVGEPLTDDIVDAVRAAWGVVVRNGYGQSEVTAVLGVAPGGRADPTSLGRPLPGYRVVLCAPDTTTPVREGEICLDPADRPAGLMHGYLDPVDTPPAGPGALYRTGDLARRESDGTFTFVGRLKDVFHTADGVRVAPAELERRLLGHPAVAEAAVVPVPAQDGGGASEAKAYVLLADGWNAGAVTAEAVLGHVNGENGENGKSGEAVRLAVLEFVDELPRTESGKIFRDRLRRFARSPLVEFTAPAPTGSPAGGRIREA